MLSNCSKNLEDNHNNQLNKVVEFTGSMYPTHTGIASLDKVDLLLRVGNNIPWDMVLLCLCLWDKDSLANSLYSHLII